jgi:integrase
VAKFKGGVAMKIKFTQSSVNNLKSTGKGYWITDGGCENLRLYIGATGKKTWYSRYRNDAGKTQSQKLGTASAISVAQAREMALDIAVRVAKGQSVKKEKAIEKITLGPLIENLYRPWVTAYRRSGSATMDMLRSTFSFLFNHPVENITIVEIEKWRLSRVADGTKASTVNRLLGALQSAINWAVKQGITPLNPIARMECLQETDSDAKVRYLSDDERERLMAALDAREDKMRAARGNHNGWLVERKHRRKPSLGEIYVDYLKPLVLLSLNTGARRGNLLSLTWGDIDFNAGTMLFRAAVSKSGKTHRIPMNDIVAETLIAWRNQAADISQDALVFQSPKTGEKLENCNTAWEGVLRAAKIENFRWHDMRHDFASRLVMLGENLNTVRELLGHSDMKMTMKYAHLAPDVKHSAVQKLAKDINNKAIAIG